MKRVAVSVSILLLLAVGILLAVAGISALNDMSSRTDLEDWFYDWAIGWLGLLLGILCCLGAGLAAAFCRPWRCRQTPGQVSGRRDGTIIQKALIGALIGFFVGPPMVVAVSTTVYSVTRQYCGDGAYADGFLTGPYGAVLGLVIGALIGGVMGSRSKK